MLSFGTHVPPVATPKNASYTRLARFYISNGIVPTHPEVLKRFITLQT